MQCDGAEVLWSCAGREGACKQDCLAAACGCDDTDAVEAPVCTAQGIVFQSACRAKVGGQQGADVIWRADMCLPRERFMHGACLLHLHHHPPGF